MKRRNFLKSSALASTAYLTPSFLNAFAKRPLQSSRSGKTLVVIQLSGGNDGLNTIVPYRDDIYYSNRPTLNLQKGEVLKISDHLGFHPALQSLQNIFDQGEMSIINSVGYPNPDRSHFRSMDIWHTASSSSEYLSSGWIGRYLDSNCKGCDKPYHAIELDNSLSLAVKGKLKTAFAMPQANMLRRTTDNRFLMEVGNSAHPDPNSPLSCLYKTMTDTQASAKYLFEQSKVHRSKIEYPNNAFAKDLKQVAELMTADTDTKVYYTSLTGFDTHAGQKERQNRLLKQYAEGVEAFVKDLKQNGLFDDTLILTFSEFGRRVKQNASQGTDHGTANNLFLIGGRLQQKGFYNEAPDLNQLDNGDLIHQVDFRTIYADILDNWLDSNSTEILGQSFNPLGLI